MQLINYSKRRVSYLIGELEQIYSANNNEIKAVKINNIVFARFSINMLNISK